MADDVIEVSLEDDEVVVVATAAPSEPIPEIPPEAYQKWAALRPKPDKDRRAFREMCRKAGCREPTDSAGGLYLVTDCMRCGGDFYVSVEAVDTRAQKPMAAWAGACVRCGLMGPVSEIFRERPTPILEVEL